MHKKNPVQRLVLCGGGSGGHVTPSLAVAKEFLKNNPEGEVLFVVSNNGLDASIVSDAGFNFKEISTGKLRRYFSWQNFLDFFRFFGGIIQSLFILKKFKADRVFSKGGFVALPVAIAAWALKIPVIAHESDTVAGLANRIIEKFAKKICVTFPIARNNPRVVPTGTPIRPEIFSADVKKGKQFLGFKNDKPIVLFMGASQGAQQINDSCEALLSDLSKIANIVLVAGKNKLLSSQFSVLNSFKQFEYLGEEFPNILAAADIVVSRAGANSLFELAALKKASIIIPLASAAGDHQRKNAESFEKKGAVIVFNSIGTALELSVLQQIQEWIQNPEQRERYEKNIGKMSVENSVEKIVEVVCN